MSRSLNCLTLSGNLGADADVKVTPGGMAVTTISMGVGYSKRKADGSGYEDGTYWVYATVYGKRGEALAPYLYKGAKVAITGHLRSHSWETDGKRHYRLEVVADEIELMTMQRQGQGSQAAQKTAAPLSANPQTAQYNPGLQAMVNQAFATGRYEAAAIYDEEIPF